MRAVSTVPWFYAIVDIEACGRVGIEPLVHAERCIAHGAAWLQLRAKVGDDRDLRDLAEEMHVRCNESGVAFVMNDRVNLAAEMGASFAHVGQGDGPAADWGRMAPSVRLGRSTHCLGEVRRAVQDAPIYVAFGPVYATATKSDASPVTGLDLLAAAHAIARACDVPLVAIGGIDATNLEDVLARADAAAFISALLPAPNEPPSGPFERLGLGPR